MKALGLGLLLLLAQVAWLVAGKRPTLWAPFHEHAVYSLEVWVNGKKLDTQQSLERYGLAKWHASSARDEAWETNSLQFVKDAIVRHELTTRERVLVTLRAKVDGEEQPPWVFDPRRGAP